jgi:Flp pilus assembly pilin Flp
MFVRVSGSEGRISNSASRNELVSTLNQHWWREVLAIARHISDGLHMEIATVKPETRVKRLKNALRDLLHDEDGAALVEYAILLALIAVVAIFFVTTFGPKVSNKFSEAAANI